MTKGRGSTAGGPSARKTEEVKQLVEEVLRTLPQPHGEDVIDEVFCAIEGNSAWRGHYDQLCEQLGKWSVNTSAGSWLAKAVGRPGKRVVPARSSLIESYSKL